MKQSANDNCEFDVNSKNFSKLVENTVGKGEIARYEQFLLFPQCFQKACFPGVPKSVIVWEWVKTHLKLKTFAGDKMTFGIMIISVFGREEDIVEKDKNAFFPIPAMFSNAFSFRVV